MPDNGGDMAIAENEDEAQAIADDVQDVEGPKIAIVVSAPARCPAIAALVWGDDVVAGGRQRGHHLAAPRFAKM